MNDRFALNYDILRKQMVCSQINMGKHTLWYQYYGRTREKLIVLLGMKRFCDFKNNNALLILLLSLWNAQVVNKTTSVDITASYKSLKYRVCDENNCICIKEQNI